MSNRYLACLVLSAFMCALLPSLAQAQTEDETFTFAITPFTGYRFGGDFQESDGDREFSIDDSSMQGIVLNIAAPAGGQWEIAYSRQDTEVDTLNVLASDPQLAIDIEELHFGGTYGFGGQNNTQPFFGMTVGVSKFDPGPGGFGSEDYFSVAFGGGVELRRNKRLGVRLEGRVTAVLIDSDSSLFCTSSAQTGGCLVFIDGKTLSQWELRAGLVFRF